jgi:hypothetical protein
VADWYPGMCSPGKPGLTRDSRVIFTESTARQSALCRDNTAQLICIAHLAWALPPTSRHHLKLSEQWCDLWQKFPKECPPCTVGNISCTVLASQYAQGKGAVCNGSHTQVLARMDERLLLWAPAQK